MSTVNRVILIGNLGADPDMKFSSAGTAICKLSIATSQKRKDQSGHYQEETQWHRVTLFGKKAEVCGERQEGLHRRAYRIRPVRGQERKHQAYNRHYCQRHAVYERQE